MAEAGQRMKEPTEDFESYDPDKKNGITIDGITFPPAQPSGVPWRQHISQLKSLQLRDSDVIICAYAKAGTHWSWEMIHMLLAGKVEYEHRTKLNLMIDFLSKEIIDGMSSPRIFNTHLPFSMLPVAEMKRKGVKVLHVYRNPKDTLVSIYYHYIQAFTCFKHYTLQQFQQVFLQEDMVFGNYFAFLKQMETFVRENPDISIHEVSYESMRKNPLEHVKQLAEFLGTGTSEELCQRIVEACSFDNLKQADDTKVMHDTLPSSVVKKVSIYRKGEVGDWKNHLTVSMNEVMDDAIKRHMAGSSYTFQFI